MRDEGKMAREHEQLRASARTEFGNGPTRRLRREGRTPGVVYQKGSESISLAFDARALRRTLSGSGRTSVIDVAIDGTTPRPAVLRDWQLDPVRDDLLHVDFQEVDLTVAIQMSVPVHLTGTAVGVREGGVLDQVLMEVVVSALPDRIPDSIDLDVSELEVGSSVAVADLVAPEGVEITEDAEHVVASVTLPSQEPAEEEEAVEAVEGEEEPAAAAEDEGGESSE
jgi:large subunit ribosomal protein L25